MNNPLLNKNIIHHNIDFNSINASHFSEALDILMPEVKAEFEITLKGQLTYENVLEEGDKSKQMQAVLTTFHALNALVQTSELREVYDKYMPILSEMYQEMSLDKRGYDMVKAYSQTPEYLVLNTMQKKMVTHIIKGYELNGIALPEDKKTILKDLMYQHTELTTKYDNNLKDVEASLEMILTKEELKGLPERSLKNIESIESTEGNVERYLVQSSSGVYGDIMSYCEVEKTREKVYLQQLEIGIKDGFDNRPLVKEIVQLNHKMAEVLGFSNYAKRSLVENMVKTPEQALEFIQNLAVKSFDTALSESKQITQFGKELLGREPLFHDRAFIVEKMQKQLFSIDSEEIRKYFPVSKVTEGLFTLIESLYDISFVENKNQNVWHADVTYYDVVDKKKDKKIGGMYMDLYKRKFKSSGAWMMGVVSSHESKTEKTLPVAHLVCNIPKDATQESTFEFDEIVTFFHEMGHTLHHLLSEVKLGYYSGLNHVEHDAIELPSQFLENFCWDYEVLKAISCHTVSGEVFPQEQYDKMLAMKNFLSASGMLRQCVLAEVDMTIYNNPEEDPLEVEKSITKKWATREIDDRSFLTPNFSHIISGGYGAGYYAYKWAEVLSSDAFAALKESGSNYLEQKEMAQLFREKILARGGAGDMQENFIEFRGREPEIEFLLKDFGIVSSHTTNKIK